MAQCKKGISDYVPKISKSLKYAFPWPTGYHVRNRQDFIELLGYDFFQKLEKQKQKDLMHG